MKKTILLTGGTGYIGSHAWCALLAAGYEVIGLETYAIVSPKWSGALMRSHRRSRALSKVM